MKAETIDLLTKLVLLAIAVIGLYKTWKFSGLKPRASTDAEPRKKEPSLLKDMLEIYSFMLVPLLFILAFSFLTKLTTSINSPDPVIAKIPELVVTEATSELELMLAAAARVNNRSTQRDELIKLVTLAIERKDFEVAIRAASNIANRSASDEQLKRVMAAVAEQESSSEPDYEPPGSEPTP